MNIREKLSKRVRFEIMKRDGFRCVYCGASRLTAVLHIDHVIAVANGGTNDPSNLVTACADCNVGKSDVPLDKVRRPTFDELVAIEPRLIPLALDAMEPDGAEWGGNRFRRLEALKPNIVRLVGRHAENPCLRTSAAYEVAYLHIESLIPDWPDAGAGDESAEVD